MKNQASKTHHERGRSMSKVNSGWRYYVPDQGEDASDTRSIMLYDWQSIFNHDQAADHAASDDWDDHDGWDFGIGHEYVMVVVSPDGVEKSFNISHEAEVVHYTSEATL